MGAQLAGQRDGQGGHAEQVPFHGRRHGTRIDRVVTHVGTEVDSRYHHVRTVFEHSGHGKVHAIGRRPIDEEESVLRPPEKERTIKSQRIAGAAAIPFGCNHGHLAQGLEPAGQSRQTRGRVAVVVAQQDSHDSRNGINSHRKASLNPAHVAGRQVVELRERVSGDYTGVGPCSEKGCVRRQFFAQRRRRRFRGSAPAAVSSDRTPTPRCTCYKLTTHWLGAKSCSKLCTTAGC